MGDALPYVNLGANVTVSHVSVGQYVTCAVVQPGGRVKCWGNNVNSESAACLLPFAFSLRQFM